jgi:hypothetical protein
VPHACVLSRNLKGDITVISKAWGVPLLLLSTLAVAQTCNTQATLPDYVQCRIAQILSMKMTIYDYSKQSEPPSLAPTSLALADTSSATDVASESVSPSVFSTHGSRQPNSTDAATTVSLYALYAAIKRVNLLDPETFYSHSTIRQFSLSFTDSFPGDSNATAGQGSYTYGLKAVLLAGRNFSSKQNAPKIQSIVNAMTSSLGPYAQGMLDIQNYLYNRVGRQFGPSPGASPSIDDFVQLLNDRTQFPKIIATLNAQDFAVLDAIINKMAPGVGAVYSTSVAAAKEISRAGQLSGSFTSRISKGTSANLYRWELIYDKPFAAWLKSTANASYDFQNAQLSTAKNRNIGRFVEQFEIPINGYGASAPLIPLSFVTSGEGDWGSNGPPIYKAQAKLKITALPGVDVPIAGT